MSQFLLLVFDFLKLLLRPVYLDLHVFARLDQELILVCKFFRLCLGLLIQFLSMGSKLHLLVCCLSHFCALLLEHVDQRLLDHLLLRDALVVRGGFLRDSYHLQVLF